MGVHINDSGFVVGRYHQSHVSRLQAQAGIIPVSRIFAIVISHRVEENQKKRCVQLLVAPYTISVQKPGYVDSYRMPVTKVVLSTQQHSASAKVLLGTAVLSTQKENHL